MMARKQPSGAQNRNKAKARANARGISMPFGTQVPALSSLTEVNREQTRAYAAYLKGKLTSDAYQTIVRGLSAMGATLANILSERQVEADERLARALEAHTRGDGALNTPRMPVATIEAKPALPEIPGGELMPRESSDDEQSARELR